METSQALQEYAKGKIQVEVGKFVSKPIEAHVTFTVDKHEQHVLCTLTGGDGFKLNVEHSCADMYGSVDHMIDKLVTQLQRKKEKLKDHKHSKGKEAFSGSENYDDDSVLDAADIIKYERAVSNRRG
jgi:putative sigma-54 modulation protein